MKAIMADEIRKNAGIIATAKKGTDIRHAMEDGFITIAAAIEQDEIPVRRLACRLYFRGIVTGLLTMNLIATIAKYL